jgi:tetratricopeptide (TPR) repeat protein
VRKAIYAHLAPQGRRVEKLARVDFILDQMEPADRGNLVLVGERLGCEALITGRVTEVSSHYYGIYSRVAVGADLKLVRAADGAVLWEGQHVAAIHGGGVPVDPISLAMGALDAATNVQDEQTFRVTDDLARRLVGTIPDDAIVALDDPPAPPVAPAASVETVPPAPEPAHLVDYQTFLNALADLPADERHALVLTAVDKRTFGDDAQGPLLDALISTTPFRAEDEVRYADYLAARGDYSGALTRAEVAAALDDRSGPAQFARGRMLIKLGKVDEAEAPILKAVAIDGGNAGYLNALGYVNGLKNDSERSLAAYRMAIEADHTDAYALYNTGVLLYNKGDDAGAADSFYRAGLAYLKAKNYGQAGKALANLKELSGRQPEPNAHIETLESALSALGNKGDQS